MRTRIVRSVITTAAVLAFAAATVIAADKPEQRAAQGRGGAMAAKSVAPGQMKKFHVTASEGKIAPNTLRVKKGERVRITFVSRDATYGIKIKEFDVKAKVAPDRPAVVEFVPTESGTFPFRCSRFWGFKHWSTNGTLVVD
jgi:cytochrome c oxidase subunit 2